MTSGTIDELRIGHILQYVYLFDAEAAQGRDEGVKQRPVIVIHIDRETRRVSVLPVTTKGDRKKNATPLPAEVAQAAGLDPTSSIVTDEYNTFRWMGYDIRPVADGWIAGRLPPGFTAKIRELAIGAKRVPRD